MTSRVQPIARGAVAAGTEISGFRVEKVSELPHIQAVFHHLRHIATGARHIHIACDDTENTFSVAFKTVPGDSSGIAHILEHTVLCGSRRFPVRDPFFSMLKRSLSSFMNAFTSSDWTMYPFCTPNRKDFYNLLDVYLDAAFFPNLDTLSFKQEGYRLDFQPAPDGSSRLVYKGVVYNEMKGAMSSPDQVLGRSLLAAIYPDTPYRFNSGGDPSVIPDLTVEGLRAFHATHYHPSNAYFYTYGNLPLEDHLAVIQERVLGRFSRIDPGTVVPSQPRWTAPRSAVFTYPIDASENIEKKSQVCVSWLTSDIRDTFEVLALTLIEQILIGNAASPLRKALIDSGIGSALCDSTGFDADNRDTLFSCGLKDVDPTDAGRIEALVLSTLQNLADTGIDPELVDTALHQFEFHRKEITNSPYPYGLKLFLTFAPTWFHDGNPERILQIDRDIEVLREQSGRGVFEDRLRRYFLDNPHRLVLTLSPDPEKRLREEAETTERLKAIESQLSEADIARIRADAEKLQSIQDADEDTSVLPTLELEDIPPSVQRLQPSNPPGSEETACYEAATNGIFYLTGALPLGRLEKDDLLLLPFLCHAFSRAGTRHKDFAELSRAINRYTGGLGLSLQARTRYDETGSPMPLITLGGKCLSRYRGPLFDLLQELFLEADFTDIERIRQLALEYRAGMETMVIQGGHRFAMSLSARKLTATAHISENWYGVHQLRFLKSETRDLSTGRLEALSRRLAQLRARLLGRNGLQLAAVGHENDIREALERISGLKASLTDQTIEPESFEAPSAGLPGREAWTTTTSVSFVAQSFRVASYRHADAPALAVMARLMRSLYLHREIREKGGAYGGFSLYNPEDGLFTFGSYRDPHVVATLRAYDRAADFIRTGAFDKGDIKEAVLQVCSDIDKPDPPGPQARKAFFRRVVGLSDDMRDEFKRRLLRLNETDIRQAADRHFRDLGRRSSVAVITSKEKLEAANRELGADGLAAFEI
ncbi:MAG: insulinase family protein [Desulfobacterales bacterium]